MLSGLGLTYAAPAISTALGMSAIAVRGCGLAVLAGGAMLIAWCRPGRAPIRLGRISIESPTRKFLCLQLVLVGIDVAGAALALFVLLPPIHIGFIAFLAVYTIALSLGVIGHTPGGLGVFETAMVFALGGTVPPEAAVAALLAYRAIYFILPLLLSGALLAAFEVRAIAIRLAPRGLVVPSPRVAQLVPMFLGVISFAIGVMLLVSGATPAFGYRLAILATTLPLWVVEGSQFLGSVLGVLLLFVARGLLRRLDAAWWLAMAIAVVSLVLSLAKGLAFFEAGVLAFLILLLAATRHRFDRPASLFQERFTLTWLVSIGIVLMVAFWVLFFAFRDVPYSHELWWQFEFDEKASRALRATDGGFAVRRRGRDVAVVAPGFGTTDAADAGRSALGRAYRARAGAQRCDACDDGRQELRVLALASAFLMYAKRGRSWVALYDPVGPREEWPALIARFVALAHAHGWPGGVLSGAAGSASAIFRRGTEAHEVGRGSVHQP